MVTSEQNITARSRCLSRICPIFNSRCRRVRFARFYIVCEEVPLGTPESPLIVCGLSDTLRECPNVAKTRNGMPAAAWKKYSNFASKNLPPSVYSGTFLFSSIPVILHITKRDTVHFMRNPFRCIASALLRTATCTRAAPPQCSKQHWRTHTRSPVHSFRSGTADWSRVQR